MDIKKLENKTVAECKGFEVSQKVMLNKNGYYFIRIYPKGKPDENEWVYLSQRLTRTMKAQGTFNYPGDAMFKVTVNADQEERMKLVTPPTPMVDATTISAWG